MGISGCLKTMLVDAQDQGRLTCGVYRAAKFLETNPCNVMLCILPENVSKDITLKIHSTLIQAFCWENEIAIIKVDDSKKIGKLLTKEPSFSKMESMDRIAVDNALAQRSRDFNCILVHTPTQGSTSEEKDVMDFLKESRQLCPIPTVYLKFD